MFWRKEKEIVFVTSEPSAFEFSKPSFVKDNLPKWFTDIKPVGRNPLEGDNYKKNIRTCSGLQDLFSRAISIPSPEDIAFKLENKDGEIIARWENTSGLTGIDYHPDDQRGDFEQKCVHVKIALPWHAKANFYVYETSPVYSDVQRRDIRVCSGVIDYSIVPAVNVNLFIDHPAVGEETLHLLKFEESLAWMIPMTDQKVKIKYELLTEEEMRRFRGRMFFRPAHTNSYRVLKKAQSNKCPFGFG